MRDRGGLEKEAVVRLSQDRLRAQAQSQGDRASDEALRHQGVPEKGLETQEKGHCHRISQSPHDGHAFVEGPYMGNGLHRDPVEDEEGLPLDRDRPLHQRDRRHGRVPAQGRTADGRNALERASSQSPAAHIPQRQRERVSGRSVR